MPDMISLGPLSLDGHLLVYVLAIVAGYWAMKLRLRSERHKEFADEARSILDIALTAVIVIALFWKFGTLLFKPSIIWERPMHILLIRGTLLHTALGFAVALLYVVFRLRRLGVRFMLFADSVPYGVLTGLIVHSLLIRQYGRPTSQPWGMSMNDPGLLYHPLNVYVLILCVLLFILLWMRPLRLGEGAVVSSFLIYCGLGLWAISMLEYSAGLTLFNEMQRVYVGMVVLGLLIPHIIRWKGVVSS